MTRGNFAEVAAGAARMRAASQRAAGKKHEQLGPKQSNFGFRV
jgi:hypothetical protein